MTIEKEKSFLNNQFLRTLSILIIPLLITGLYLNWNLEDGIPTPLVWISFYISFSSLCLVLYTKNRAQLKAPKIWSNYFALFLFKSIILFGIIYWTVIVINNLTPILFLYTFISFLELALLSKTLKLS